MMTALAFIGAFVMIVVSTIFKGFTLSMLWRWFVIPTFSNAPILGVVPAIGIALMVSYLTHQTLNIREDKKKEEENNLQKLAHDAVISIIVTSFALLIGWITHLFM